MTAPRVSIVLSSFNHGRFVAEAIQSVLDQTFDDFELFVIDDCSADESWDVIRRFTDPRLHAVRNDSRMRGAFGFNQTIRERTRGEFVAIHHSDDAWLPDKLATQVAILDREPGTAAVFARAIAIDEAGTTLPAGSHKYSTIFDQPNRSRHEWLRHFFFEGNCLCHPSVLARRQALLDAGLYDRRLGQLGDLDLWVRLCLQAGLHVHQTPLVRYRVLLGEANESGSRPESLNRGNVELLQILRHYLRLGRLTEVAGVFPEITIPTAATDTDVPFLVARFAAHQDRVVHRLFGISALYEMLREPAATAQIEERHGFTLPQLVALAGTRDFVGALTEQALAQSRAGLADARRELARVKGTVSWRVTGPLRAAWNAWRRLLPR